MNEAIDVILHRRSVRAYKPEAIPEETLKIILQAGCAAPHGGPAGPWKFLVIRNDQLKRQLLDAEKRGIDRVQGGPPKDGYWNSFFAHAPVVIAVAFKPTSVGGFDEESEIRIGLSSAACAMENMLLAAAAMGLGACLAGPMPEAKDDFEAILGIEPPWEFIALIPIGKPAQPARREKVKPVGESVEFLD